MRHSPKARALRRLTRTERDAEPQRGPSGDLPGCRSDGDRAARAGRGWTSWKVLEHAGCGTNHPRAVRTSAEWCNAYVAAGACGLLRRRTVPQARGVFYQGYGRLHRGSHARVPPGCARVPDLEILEGRCATHLAWAKRPPHHVKGRNRKQDGPPGSWAPHRWA